jgi:hypothetical protein
LIVTGAIGLLLNSLAVLANVFRLAARFGPQPGNIDPAIGSGAGVLGIILAVLLIIGGVKMRKLESFGLAMTASVIAVIPCFSPCCVTGLPFGIWALVVLSDAYVRGAFRS